MATTDTTVNKTVNIAIDPELWKELKIEAVRLDGTIATTVTEAIRFWLDSRRPQ